MSSEGAKRFFYGWYIAGVCLLIYLFTNGMSIFVPQNLFPRFMETFAATEGQVSLTTGLMFGVTILLAPFAGALIDRFGPLRIIRIGLAVWFLVYVPYAWIQGSLQIFPWRVMAVLLAWGFFECLVAALLAGAVHRRLKPEYARY